MKAIKTFNLIYLVIQFFEHTYTQGLFSGEIVRDLLINFFCKNLIEIYQMGEKSHTKK